MNDTPIRRPRPDELPRLQAVEIAAGACFAEVGMVEIARDDPPSLDVLGEHLCAGRLFVAGDPAGAYVIWSYVDGAAHVDQVSVHPDHARLGVGRRLLDRVQTVTGAALTLTTFRDVPWNAPYYARWGFEVVEAPAWGPGLVEVVRHENDLGLGRWPRVVMRREVAHSH